MDSKIRFTALLNITMLMSKLVSHALKVKGKAHLCSQDLYPLECLFLGELSPCFGRFSLHIEIKRKEEPKWKKKSSVVCFQQLWLDSLLPWL